MNELPDIKKIKVCIDKIENDVTIEKNLFLFLLRLDKIDPAVSGNKLFKLYYFLKEALSSHKKIITFGGAYSNHLAATAAACKAYNISCIGIVRGEKPEILSHTLFFCREKGMRLEFISRENYNKKDTEDFKKDLLTKFGDHLLIPEGGFCEPGMRGAALIANLYKKEDFTHVCCAVGTATTLAGLIKSSDKKQKLIGFNVLNNLDSENRINHLLNDISYKNYSFINDYHFGGYAKNNNQLIAFMNTFYGEFGIPTDFVYTAKMMYGVFDLIKKKYFASASRILCIHTGGLQGNLSLPHKTLNF